jgi:hypothetical protein
MTCSHWSAALRVGAVAAFIVISSPALAQESELGSLRSALESLKSDSAARIAALEARIAELERNAASNATPTPAPAAALSGGNSALAFNPSMSVILSGGFTHTSLDPASYRIGGFMPAGDGVGPGSRGFSLSESELTLAANVDPYFYANLTASIASDDAIHVEEAYVKTIALPSGLSVKGGRFFSGIGYLNEVHSHAWDFVDQPLVYQAMLNGQYAQDGAQLKWVAPTVLFVELGAEAGNGQSFPGTTLGRNGLNSTALMAHLGADVGDSTSWRAGLSWMTQQAEDRVFDNALPNGNVVPNAFTGDSRLWVADATLKWSPHGNSQLHSLKLQGEYMQRVESGMTLTTAGYHSQQSGWYLQGVYQFRPRWRVGTRYDSLDSGAPHVSPSRVSLMLDWNPSEFTRLRAQYALDEARTTENDNEWRLQYLFSIGAHGAHKF